jgi:conjugative transfer signal peptidase TraF
VTLSNHNHHDGRAFAFLALRIATVVWSVAAAAYFLGLRFNATPSLPIGFWLIKPLRTPVARGMIVSFSFPCTEEQHRFCRSAISLGCSSRSVPLLKPIIAVPGDAVSVSDGGMAINDTPLSNSARLPMQIDPVSSGRYLVPNARFWAVSTLHARSFDSRYFEAVGIECIQGQALKLMAG